MADLIHKVLLCGAINGKFKKLIDRVKVIEEKHGPFVAIFSSGSAFDTGNNEEYEELRFGKIKIPVPVYILGPQIPIHTKHYFSKGELENGHELCENLHYLGSTGFLTLTSGITIAYISSSMNPLENNAMIDNKNFYLLKKLVDNIKGFKGVDFLLTPCWPQNVVLNANIPPNYNEALKTSSIHVSHLANILKPRYHLANSMINHGVLYERAPYRNNHPNASELKHITRFVSLGSLDHPENHKWLFAIKITPIFLMPPKELVIQPDDTTDTPYESLPVMGSGDKYNPYSGKKRKVDYDFSNVEKKENISGHKENCWFCLSNPKVDKDIVIHVGIHSYLVLAKGGLVPWHLLIVPIEHFPSFYSLPSQVKKEIEEMKILVQNLFATKSESIIFYERNYHSIHLQIQAIPIPVIEVEKLTAIFIRNFENEGMNFCKLNPEETPRLEKMLTNNTKYFLVDFENKERLLHIIDSKFPLFFGRKIICGDEVLKLPVYKEDWKNCVLPKKEECKVVSDIKLSLKKVLDPNAD